MGRHLDTSAERVARDAEIVRLYVAEKLPMEEVGERFRLTRERVRQILRDAGVSSRSRSEALRTRLSAAEVESVRALHVLYLGGKTLKAVAEAADYSPAELRLRIKSLGLTYPRPLSDYPHGTTQRYRRGCHCPSCRVANAESVAEWKLARRASA